MIRTDADGTILINNEHVQVFSLLSLYSRLKLESKGYKCRGASALSAIKQITGMKGTSATMVPKYEVWLRERNILS